MRMTIIGLPLSGKTTFFNLIAAHGSAGSASGKKGVPICTVPVPDPRLDALTAVYNPQKQVNATLEFIDTPALTSGADISNFAPPALEEIRRADALCLIIREFDTPMAPHPAGSVDGVRDLDGILSEMLIQDMVTLEKRQSGLKKSAASSPQSDSARELDSVERVMAALENDVPVRDMGLSIQDRSNLSTYQFLTDKPILVLVNVGEGQLGSIDDIIATYRERYPALSFSAIAAQIELDLDGMEEDECAEFMEDLGISEFAFKRILRAFWEDLGLRVFYTIGEDECRAWPITEGTAAVEAAGTIHTDLMRGFIRAQVLAYEEFEAQPVKDTFKTRSRQERRDYPVQNGDLIEILFNV